MNSNSISMDGKLISVGDKIKFTVHSWDGQRTATRVVRYVYDTTIGVKFDGCDPFFIGSLDSDFIHEVTHPSGERT